MTKLDMTTLLGAGAWGKVYHETRQGSSCAVKYIIFYEKDQRVASAEHEVSIHRRLSHVNIIQLLECHKHSDHMEIVMELGNTCLFEEVQKEHWTKRKSQVVFHDIACGLQYMHSIHIVHRDIKLENVVLCHNKNSITAKLIDFGLAHAFSDKDDCHLQHVVGSQMYLAPEAYSGRKFDAYQVDMWALGVVLFAMLTKSMPFNEASGRDHRFVHVHRAMKLRATPIDAISITFQEQNISSLLSFDETMLLNSLLQVNNHRGTMSDVMESMYVSSRMR